MIVCNTHPLNFWRSSTKALILVQMLFLRWLRNWRAAVQKMPNGCPKKDVECKTINGCKHRLTIVGSLGVSTTSCRHGCRLGQCLKAELLELINCSFAEAGHRAERRISRNDVILSQKGVCVNIGYICNHICNKNLNSNI